MIASRRLALLALGVGLVALAWLADDRAGRPLDDPDLAPSKPTARTDFATAEACRACHPVHWDEWERSPHAFSPRDPVFTMFATTGLRVEPGSPECQRCHHPAPVFETALGNVPRPRPAEQDAGSGVTCLTCHALGEGVAAARASDAPCRPRPAEALRSARFCAACHQNQQPLLRRQHEYEEWTERSALTADRTCVDCHMDVVVRPIVPGGEPRPSRAHTFGASRDPEVLRRALALDAQVIERRVTLVLRNLGTGHRLPTGYRIRRLWVDARIEDEETPGRVLWEDSHVLHREPREGGENTQLRDGEVRIVRFDPLPAAIERGVLRVTAELAYAPFQPPTEIHALERTFPHDPLPLPAPMVPARASLAPPGTDGAAPSASAAFLLGGLGAAFLALWLLGALRKRT